MVLLRRWRVRITDSDAETRWHMAPTQLFRPNGKAIHESQRTSALDEPARASTVVQLLLDCTVAWRRVRNSTAQVCQACYDNVNTNFMLHRLRNSRVGESKRLIFSLRSCHRAISFHLQYRNAKRRLILKHPTTNTQFERARYRVREKLSLSLSLVLKSGKRESTNGRSVSSRSRPHFECEREKQKGEVAARRIRFCRFCSNTNPLCRLLSLHSSPVGSFVTRLARVSIHTSSRPPTVIAGRQPRHRKINQHREFPF